ncbi:protein EFR3 homolog B-like, partial [Cyanistes caeruleus]|uniref:protein EFR3 homolog B-like n=1 Tax=Cyanistes caeruleus TaxID=156563 RepID=UPI000CDB3E1B
MFPQHGPQLFRHIFLLSREGNNSREHFQALFRLLALLSLELASDDVIVDLVRLVLALQDLAQEEPLPFYNRCALLALGAAFLALLGTLLGNPGLRLHVQE